VKNLTYSEISSWNPCYDPIKVIPAEFSGTALDLLKTESVPPVDRIWTVVRPGILSDKLLRLFGIWCASQALASKPDPTMKAMLDAATQFANGTIDKATYSTTENAASAMMDSLGKKKDNVVSAVFHAVFGSPERAASYHSAHSKDRKVTEIMQLNQLTQMVTDGVATGDVL
jgi:hypothetical protein